MATTCPKCGYTRNPTDEAPDWQCPACGVAYVKARESRGTPRPPPPSPASRQAMPDVNRSGAFFRRYRHAIALLAVGCTGLVLGYFAGRAHLQYQLATALTTAAEQIARSFSQEPSPAPRATDAAPTSAPAAERSPAPPIAPPRPNLITASLVNKGFRPANFREGNIDDQITLVIQFRNATTRDIRAFDGVMRFTDLLGNPLMNVTIAVNNPLAAGQATRWDGFVNYNQFLDDHQRLRGAQQQNMQMTFTVKKVLYTDGEVELLD